MSTANGEKKKLGLRDKLMKMLDGDSSPKDKKTAPEADKIKFTLSGGSVHSELLVAEAVMDSGENAGMPLPIVCKWYNKSRTDELTEIEGVTGAFYQPSADDIDTTIVVEASPLLEGKPYTGEVLRKEAGPLVLDKQIQEEVQELLEAGRCGVAAKLEGIIKDGDDKNESKNHQLPTNCSLSIDVDKVTLTVPVDESLNLTCALTQTYPVIHIIKRTNSAFLLVFSPTLSYRLQAHSNTHRDVIVVALRMFCGRKLIHKELPDGNQSTNGTLIQGQSSEISAKEMAGEEKKQQLVEGQPQTTKVSSNGQTEQQKIPDSNGKVEIETKTSQETSSQIEKPVTANTATTTAATTVNGIVLPPPSQQSSVDQPQTKTTIPPQQLPEQIVKNGQQESSGMASQQQQSQQLQQQQPQQQPTQVTNQEFVTPTAPRTNKAVPSVVTPFSSQQSASANGGSASSNTSFLPQPSCCEHCIHRGLSPEAKFRQRQQSLASSESYEVFLKLNELIKKTAGLETLRDELKEKVNQLTGEIKQRDETILAKSQEIAQLAQKNKEQEELAETFKSKHEQYMDEKLFLTQEQLVMSQELQDKTAQTEQLREELENLQNEIGRRNSIVKKSDVESLKKLVKEQAEKLKVFSLEREEEQLKMSESEIKVAEALQTRETLENELLYLKKKTDSLLQDRQQLQKTIQDNAGQIKQLQQQIESLSAGSSTQSNSKLRESQSQLPQAFSQSVELSQSQLQNIQQQQSMPILSQKNSGSSQELSEFKPNSHRGSLEEDQQQKLHLSPSQPGKDIKDGSQGTLPSIPAIGKCQSQQLPAKNFVINFTKPSVTEDISTQQQCSHNHSSYSDFQQTVQFLKNEIQLKIDEIFILEKRITSLESTLDTVSKAYTQDVQAINSGSSKRKGREAGNEQTLQKIVNSLTELITEKDYALENQKKINRDLVTKLHEAHSAAQSDGSKQIQSSSY